jgi:hypothetical protein
MHGGYNVKFREDNVSELSASRSGRFTTIERIPDEHLTGSGFVRGIKRKISPYPK